MPRFHFHVHGGDGLLDEEGIDLPDVQTARMEAIRLAGGMLLDQASLIHEEKGWRLSVTDSCGKPILRVDVNIVDIMALQ